jgi:hypothetical protein
MFKTTSIKANGTVEDYTHVFHHQAFAQAVASTGNVLSMIRETRWCTDTMTMKSINYIVRDHSVYSPGDNFYPVYSIKPEFKNIMMHRENLYAIICRAIRSYEFYDQKCPYSTEFLYSYTVKDLETLRDTIKEDEVCKDFFGKIDHHLSRMYSAAQCVDVTLPNLMVWIDKIPVKATFHYIENLNRLVDAMVISKAYGGADHQLLLDNSLKVWG